MLQNEIEAKLTQFRDLYSLSQKAIKNIRIEVDSILIEIVIGYPHQRIKNEMIKAVALLIQPIAPNKTIHTHLIMQIDSHSSKPGIPPLPHVKNIIAIASGKGGVGKSTIAVNLALALAKEGAQVGLLDADIYGPSQPLLLGTYDMRPIIQNKTIQPLIKHGIQSISIGNLVETKATLAWRGPMLGKALEQLIHDTQWNNLDYLIVDLPPGTGDVQLTLCQKIPVAGALIVTTPQDLALLDVRRACEMFNKLNVTILGVVENMSVYHCIECGREARIFGEGGALKLAQEYNLSVLVNIPLDMRIREMTEAGSPAVLFDETNESLDVFFEMAHKVAAKLTLQTKSYSAKFPKIVVEHRNEFKD